MTAVQRPQAPRQPLGSALEHVAFAAAMEGDEDGVYDALATLLPDELSAALTGAEMFIMVAGWLSRGER